MRITTGWSDEGKQLYSYLGYYKTRPEAINALADYNNNPYDLDANKITFEQMYVKFIKEKAEKVSKYSMKGYQLGYKHSSSLYKVKFKDLRKSHLQSVIDNCDKSYSTKNMIKVLYNQMFKMAMENDLIQKDYSKFIEMPPKATSGKREPFDQKEIDMLWEHINEIEDLDTVLIMIYTGLRPSELLNLKLENIYLEDRYMIGGQKTKAGTDRIIPIHKKIHSLIKGRIDKREKYLITTKHNTQMTYSTYIQKRWKVFKDELKFDHKPHDCRHTFATLMDNSGANKIAIKRIMGHAVTDITDGVYTHKNLEELIKAIDKLD